MSSGMECEIKKIRLIKSGITLKSCCDKSTFLMSTVILQDLQIIQKSLIFVSNNKSEKDVITDYNYVAAVFFLKKLVAVNHEARSFICSAIDENWSIGIETKERLFNEFIRDKFASHYEKQKSKFDHDEEFLKNGNLEFWSQDSNSGNEIFACSADFMMGQIFSRMKNDCFDGVDQKREVYLAKMFELTTKISRSIQEKIRSYVGSCIESHNDLKSCEVEAENINDIRLSYLFNQ